MTLPVWRHLLGWRARNPATPSSPLDQTLFWWSDRDPFTVRHHLNGGTCYIGRAGSGKTSSSSMYHAKALARLGGSGGLILCAKPEDLGMWQKIFADAGRADDLLVFGPDAPLRFNFLAYVLAMGGSVRDTVRCIMVMSENLGAADTKGGENGDIWQREAERMLFVVVSVIHQAAGTVSAPDIHVFILSMPKEPKQLKEEAWLQGYCGRTLGAAFGSQKTPRQQSDFQQAFDYVTKEYPSMAERMRSSIETMVLGILHVLNSGIVKDLVSTATNVSPDDMFRGKWVIVDFPQCVWGDSGAVFNAGWKYLTQKAVLRRHADESTSNVVTIWADEAGQVVNSFDAMFITQCRSHMGCLVYLAQSIFSYYGALKGSDGKNQAEALLTNFSTRVFHAVGDAQTASWAQGMLGNQLECFVSTSTPPSDEPFGELFGGGKTSHSVSHQYQPVLQTGALMHGLRTGGPANGLMCDAIVIRSAEPFSDGRNWMKVAFSQKH